MKKILYAVLALLILGGIAFALSKSSLLKGALPGSDFGAPEAETADPGDVDTGLDLDGFSPGFGGVTPTDGPTPEPGDDDDDDNDDGGDETDGPLTNPDLAFTPGSQTGDDDDDDVGDPDSDPTETGEDVSLNFTVTDLSYDENLNYFIATVCAENTDDSNYDSGTDNILQFEANGASYSLPWEIEEGCNSYSSGDLQLKYGIDTAGTYEVTATVDTDNSHTESDETDNAYTEELTLESNYYLAEEDEGASEEIDFSIESLRFSFSDGLLKPTLCLEGQLSPSQEEISIYFAVTQDQQELDADENASIASADLTSDACTEVNVGTDILAVTGAVDIVMVVDYLGEVSESNEQNNTYSEKITIEEESTGDDDDDDGTEEISYVCKELNIDPDTYTLVEGEDVEMTVSVELKEDTEEMTFWGKAFAFVQDLLPDWDFLMASFNNVDLDSDPITYWSDNLIIQTDGTGTFTDSNGASGSSLTVALYETSEESALSENFTYTPAVDDEADRTITATIENEQGCNDQLTLEDAEDAADATEEETTEETTDEEIVYEDSTSEESDDSTSDSGDSTSDSGDDWTSSTSSTSGDEDEDEEAEAEEDIEISVTNTILTSKEYSCSEPFSDVYEDDWYGNNVCRMYAAEIVQGRNDDSFVPSGNMTRAEALKVLLLLGAYTTDDADNLSEGFSDVNSSDWFYEYVVIAQDLDVVRTRDSTTFRPNDSITRGEFMVMMARMSGETLYGWDDDDIPFSDIDTSYFGTYAILIGYNTWVEDPENGTIRVFEGYSDGTSGANESINRAEGVALGLRFYLAWYAD